VLRDAIVAFAESHVDRDDLIPVQVRQIATLGLLANPIVNFNIELWTSWLIAGTGGPCVFRIFMSDEARLRGEIVHRYGPVQKSFARSVYHPHGSGEVSGRCVLTLSDYRRLGGTLAFQLAVHQAFQTNLAIVGMSLDDLYLREQITAFRDQIGNVIWFTDRDPRADSALHRWLWVNDVYVISVAADWTDFWSGVERNLPQPNETELRSQWFFVVNSAYRLLYTAGDWTQRAELIETLFKDSQTAAWYRHMARLAGEPDNVQSRQWTEKQMQVYQGLINFLEASRKKIN
jgi:hypothetical protein